jgi:hypothetical protein
MGSLWVGDIVYEMDGSCACLLRSNYFTSSVLS